MSSVMRWMSCGLLAAAIAITGFAPAQAQRDGRPPARAEVSGVLKAVDSVAGTITITTFEGRQQPGGDKTFSLAKDVEIVVASAGGRRALFRQAKLTDLVAGVRVGLTLSADQKSVDGIVAEGPTVRAIVKSADATNNSLTVTLPPSRAGRGEPATAEEKTYTLAAGAEIAVDDGRGRVYSVKEAKLTDLAGGSFVNLRLTTDQKQIQAVLAEGLTLSGTIKGIDLTAKTITLTLSPGRGNDAAEERTISVDADAQLLVDDGKGRRLSVKEAKLAELPVGSIANVRLSVDQKSATTVRAEGPSQFGLIKAVDPAKNTLTLAIGRGRGENPDEKTLEVAKDVRVVIDGNTAKLADIKVEERGPFAQVRLSLDQKTVQAILLIRPRQ